MLLWLFQLALFFPGSTVFGIEKPAVVYKPQLNNLVIEVNGEERVVKPSGTISVIWGDEVRIRAAYFDSEVKGVSVNFVGYPNRDSQQPANDIGFLVKTHDGLLPRYSVDGKGVRYALKVSSRGQVMGVAYIEIIKPDLEYIVLKVNGQDRALQRGEVLSVKSSDLFEVVNIKTNMGDLDSVEYKIMPFYESEKADRKYLEIRLYRYNAMFAKIPVYMEKG